jgi:hypothetical protein
MRIRRHPLAASSLGTTREVVSFHYGTPGAPKAYIQAALHADELPGMLVAHHLRRELEALEARGEVQGEVVVVPVANPIGLAQQVQRQPFGRFDLATGENFNRHYPDLVDAVAGQVGERLGPDGPANALVIRDALRVAIAGRKGVTELEGLRLALLSLAVDADIVLDLHCDVQAALHLFISRKDWPGPAEALAADIGAQATLYNEPYPDVLTFSGANGALWARLAERFPAAAIPQACLSATIEYRGQHDVNHRYGEADAKNLFRFLMRRGVVAGRARPLPRLKARATPIGGMDVGYVPKPGFLTFHVREGERVRKGQAVCEVIDPADPRGPLARTRMLSRTDGILFSRRPDGRLAWPGMVAYRIAGAKPLAHRKGMSGLDD